MKLCVTLLLLSFGATLTSAGSNECCLNDLLSLNSLMKSLASTLLESAKLDCIDVKQSGSQSTCSEGYSLTGCACGMGCGSWDTRTGNTCHCQCGNMDWTTARCCKIAVKA
ncbi:resistin-like beta [Pelodytes ibericus]